jgi:hypothetical protein
MAETGLIPLNEWQAEQEKTKQPSGLIPLDQWQAEQATAKQPSGLIPLDQWQTEQAELNKPDLEMEAWLSGIARAETQGIQNPYAARNPQSSAVGRYQFIWSFWAEKSGHIKKFANKPNLTIQDFVNNPNLQEDYARFYYKDQIVPQANTLAKQYKNVLKARGVQDMDDLRALVHFRGMDEAAYFLRTGIPPKTGKAANKSISDYLADVRKGRDEFRQKQAPTVQAAKAELPPPPVAAAAAAPEKKDLLEPFRTRKDYEVLKKELDKYVTPEEKAKLDKEVLENTPGLKPDRVKEIRILPSEIQALAKKYNVDPEKLKDYAPFMGAPMATTGFWEELKQTPTYLAGGASELFGFGFPQKLTIEAQKNPAMVAALDDLRTIAQEKQPFLVKAAQFVGGIKAGVSVAGKAAEAVKGLGKATQAVVGTGTALGEAAVAGASQAERGKEVAGAATGVLFAGTLMGAVKGTTAVVSGVNKLRTRTSEALQKADPQFFEKAATEAQQKFSESRSILNTTVISNASVTGEDLKDATTLATKLGNDNVEALYKIAVDTRPDKAKRIESEITTNVANLKSQIQDVQAQLDFTRLAPENVANLRGQLQNRIDELSQGVSPTRAGKLVDEIQSLRGMLADAAASPDKIKKLEDTLSGLQLKLQKTDIDPKAAVVRSHVENFVRSFASDILGTKVAYRQGDPLAALRVYTKQPERLQQDLERFFFKQHARAKIRAENYKAMPDAAPTLKRIGDATQASRWTAEAIDRKHGTKMQMVIDGMARQYNDLHAYIRPRAAEVSDLIKQTREANIDTETLYKALDKGTDEANPVVQGWRKYFSSVLEDAKTLGVDIQARKNYVPIKMLPSDELSAALTKRVEDLKTSGVLDLNNVSPDAEQVKVLKENPLVKELFDSLDLLSSERGDYRTKLLSVLNDARQGTVQNVGTARALRRAEEVGNMPDLIKDKDVGRLAQNWVESVFKSGVMRDSMAQLRDYADLMKRVGDKNANRYIQNLLADLNGYPRDGGLGKELSKLKAKNAAYLQEKALTADNAIERKLYSGISALTDAGPLLHKTMYGNALGFSARQVVTNISSMVTMALPELGYVQGGKLAAKALIRVANLYSTGERIVVRSPEVAKKLGVKVGDTAVVRSPRLLLQNEGLASSQWNESLERSITNSLKKSGFQEATDKAFDTYNRVALFAFEASETIMRSMVRYMAKDLSKMHGKGAQDYETFLKTLPRAYRQAVDEAKDVATREKVMTDYLIAKTVFNYNQSSASEVSRSLGPILSSFTKWPTEILGDTINTFAKNGVTAGTADLVYRRFAPLYGLILVSNLLGTKDSDKDSPMYQFVRRDSLAYMSPLNSLASLFEGDVAPPVVSIPAQVGKAAVTADPKAAAKATQEAIRLFVPGGGILSDMIKEYSEDKK